MQDLILVEKMMVGHLHQDDLAQKEDTDGVPKVLGDQLRLVITGTQNHLRETLHLDDQR